MDNINEKIYWVWLSEIKGLGSIKKQKLLEKFKTPQKIYMANKSELQEIENLSDEIIEKILDKALKNNVNKKIDYMIKNNIDIISIEDKSYPQILKEIHDYPISLYIKGNKEILNSENIAIIGCRQATEYGIKAAKYFGYNLAKEGINVVSGLARGVDSYSHIGAICGGKTIAVVGNGLDTVYPKENIYLEEKIIETGGAIISEYPIGTKPEKINFPARNRIISGMSKAIIVVEAKQKSGTLLTVDFALEQGRDVYVVPGNINSINSVGTNDLIKQGAKVITNYKEVL